MLKNNTKVFIRGFNIYRSDSNVGRRGTAMLISNNINAEIYKTTADADRRFVKVKIKDRQNDTAVTIATAYVEPQYEEQANIIIPTEVVNSDIISGDLNKAI